MGDNDELRELEEASLCGLPALHTERYDGWVLRQSNGYARRANSVWPLYHSTLGLDEKLAYCEHSYATAGLPCTFKLTRSSEPGDLDAILASRGYKRDAETIVQVRDLSGEPSSSKAVELSPIPDGAWMDTWTALSDRGTRASILGELLRRICTPAVYALVRIDAEWVACGRAVISGPWVGLFDLLVAPVYRGMGLGRALSRARLSWGYRQGARRAFLQVMDQNTAARRLQTSIGFVERYRYWYRVTG